MQKIKIVQKVLTVRSLSLALLPTLVSLLVGFPVPARAGGAEKPDPAKEVKKYCLSAQASATAMEAAKTSAVKCRDEVKILDLQFKEIAKSGMSIFDRSSKLAKSLTVFDDVKKQYDGLVADIRGWNKAADDRWPKFENSCTAFNEAVKKFEEADADYYANQQKAYDSKWTGDKLNKEAEKVYDDFITYSLSPTTGGIREEIKKLNREFSDLKDSLGASERSYRKQIESANQFLRVVENWLDSGNSTPHNNGEKFYTLQFAYADGTEIPGFKTQYRSSQNAEILKPSTTPKPYRTGLQFAYWAKDREGTNEFKDFGTFKLSDDVSSLTLFAIFAETGIPVVFYDEDGQTLIHKGEMKLSDVIPQNIMGLKDGYDNDGWSTVKGSSEVNVGEKDTLGKFLPYDGKSVTFYAVRSPKKYTVRFLVGTKDKPKVWQEQKGSVTQKIFPPVPPEEKGRKFLGWYRDPAGVKNKFTGGTVTENFDVYARFETETFTATFYKMVRPGEKEIFKKIDFSLDKPLLPPAENPETDGWRFESWSTRPDTLVAPDFSGQPLENCTFYAFGRFRTYSVEFCDRGKLLKSIPVQHGQLLPRPVLQDADGNIVKPLGWARRTNGSPKEYWDFFNDRVDKESVKKFCAVWPLDNSPGELFLREFVSK